MGGSADFIDLENCGLVVIALLGLPGAAAKEVGVVESRIVVAPIADVLDGARASDCGLESGRLSDEPVRHIAAVTVATDGEVIGIGDASVHQRVNAFENIFAGTRDDDRNNPLQKFIAVARGTAVVGLEHQPAIGSRKCGPLIPVGLEMISIRVGRPAVNEREHRQVLRLKFSRGIDQHAFDRGAIVSLPFIGLALRKFALGKETVEGRDRAGTLEKVWAFSEIDLRGSPECRINIGDAQGAQSGRELLVGSIRAIKLLQRTRRLGSGVHLDFGAEARGYDYAVPVGAVAIYLADEIFAPLLDGAALAINPVQMRLKIAIRTGYVSDFYAEENVAVVAGPMKPGFLGLIIRKAARLWICQIEGVDFVVFELLLPLID